MLTRCAARGRRLQHVSPPLHSDALQPPGGGRPALPRVPRPGRVLPLLQRRGRLRHPGPGLAGAGRVHRRGEAHWQQGGQGCGQGRQGSAARCCSWRSPESVACGRIPAACIRVPLFAARACRRWSAACPHTDGPSGGCSPTCITRVLTRQRCRWSSTRCGSGAAGGWVAQAAVPGRTLAKQAVESDQRGNLGLLGCCHNLPNWHASTDGGSESVGREGWGGGYREWPSRVPTCPASRLPPATAHCRQLPNDYISFHPDSFRPGPVEPGVFSLPSDACSARCPLASVCTLLQARASAGVALRRWRQRGWWRAGGAGRRGSASTR